MEEEMREIKVRAWDRDNKKMIYSNMGITNNMESWEILKLFDVVMQYTGLKDKNGKEIYEGDIINFSISQTQHYKATVIWNDAGFYSSVFHEKHDPFGDRKEPWEMYWSKGNYSFYNFSKELLDLEIIGNIYENPELLKDNGMKIHNNKGE